jgi:hypothetical protein
MGGARQQLADQALFSPGAVFQVDQEPVESVEGTHLGDER